MSGFRAWFAELGPGGFTPRTHGQKPGGFTPRTHAQKPGGFTPRTPQRIWGKMKGRGVLVNGCLLADGAWA